MSSNSLFLLTLPQTQVIYFQLDIPPAYHGTYISLTTFSYLIMSQPFSQDGKACGCGYAYSVHYTVMWFSTTRVVITSQELYVVPIIGLTFPDDMKD